jgi:hypothetical protein
MKTDLVSGLLLQGSCRPNNIQVVATTWGHYILIVYMSLGQVVNLETKQFGFLRKCCGHWRHLRNSISGMRWDSSRLLGTGTAGFPSPGRLDARPAQWEMHAFVFAGGRLTVTARDCCLMPLAKKYIGRWSRCLLICPAEVLWCPFL